MTLYLDWNILRLVHLSLQNQQLLKFYTQVYYCVTFINKAIFDQFNLDVEVGYIEEMMMITFRV